MAEFIFNFLASEKGLQDKVQANSAAVTEDDIGSDMYPSSKAKLTEKGIPFTHHSARLFTRDEYARWDRIAVMDSDNLVLAKRIAGKDPEGKISLLLPTAIEDPWYTRDFETAYNDIRKGCEALLESLNL